MFFKNKSDKLRFLLNFTVSYSVLLFIILILGIYLYTIGLREAKDNLKNSITSSFESSIQDVDNKFSIMTSLSSQIVSNTTIRNLIKTTTITPGVFYGQANDVMNYFSTFTPTQNLTYVDSYYVYMHNTNFLISPYFFKNIGLFYKYSSGYNWDLLEEWMNRLRTANPTGEFISMDRYSKTGQSDILLYVIPANSLVISNNLPATICYEINKQSLSELFSDIDLYKTGLIFATDENNNEVFHRIDTNTAPMNYSSISSVLQSTPDATNIYLENKKMAVIRGYSDTLKWNYYLIQPRDLALGTLSSYQTPAIIVILFALLIGSCIIVLISMRNTRPILYIISQLDDSRLEKANLQLELDRQQPIIMASNLNRLLKGLIITKSEMEYIRQSLGIKEDRKKFVVFSVTIFLEKNNVEDLINLDSYKEFILEILKKFFSDEILIIEENYCTFSVLYPIETFSNEDNFYMDIKQKFSKAKQNLCDNYHLSMFCSVGNISYDLFKVWQSYQQSLESLSYVSYENDFQLYDRIQRQNNIYYYPIELEQQLTHFITIGNEKQLKDLMNTIYRENFTDRNLSISMQNCLISDIRNTLLKIIFTLDDKKYKTNIEMIKPSLNEHVNFGTLEEMSLKLCQLSIQKPEGNYLIQSIKQYIKENYNDRDLGLNKISEKFDISESYFSYLFKAETHENFSDYLEKIRMEQAVHLIKNTDINLTSLYIEVGYNNAASFRRVFKKYYGVTPKAMRDIK